MTTISFQKKHLKGYVYYIHGKKNQIYVGCTTQHPNQRLMHAYVDYKIGKPNLSSSLIFELNNTPCDIPIKELNNHVEIVVIQEFENVSRSDLCKVEAYWIAVYSEICVNSRKGGKYVYRDEFGMPVYKSYDLEWSISI